MRNRGSTLLIAFAAVLRRQHSGRRTAVDHERALQPRAATASLEREIHALGVAADRAGVGRLCGAGATWRPSNVLLERRWRQRMLHGLPSRARRRQRRDH